MSAESTLYSKRALRDAMVKDIREFADQIMEVCDADDMIEVSLRFQVLGDDGPQPLIVLDRARGKLQ